MAKPTKKNASEPKSIQNRRARFDYRMDDEVEAGVALVGSEVKSIYKGMANLTDSYCREKNGEMWLVNADVEPYANTSVFAPDRRRDRKLLLHRKEIETLQRKTLEKGYSLIPISVYFKNGRVKVLIGLGKGKAEYDKRIKVADDQARREADRVRKGKYGLD